MTGVQTPARQARLTEWAIRTAAALAFGGIALIFIMVVFFALPVFMQPGSASPLSWTWSPAQGQFGILPMLAGSLMVSSLAMVFALPLALAVACWLPCARRHALFHLVNATLRVMAAIPTVVYGFLAIFLLTPLIRQALGGAGVCWLAASLMLALLVLPTMVMVLLAGLQPRLDALRCGGLALGFSRMELLWFFVLPQAGKTILAATVLGFGRAIGDTLLPLMLAGNAPQVPHGPGDSVRTLTAHMALVTANEAGGAAWNSLFAAGLLLLLINAVISLGSRRLQARAGVRTP